VIHSPMSISSEGHEDANVVFRFEIPVK